MKGREESWQDWQIALAVTAALRLFYSGFAAALSFFLHPDPSLIRSNALTENLAAPGSWHYAWLGVWERFDTLWYLRIAQRGYDLPMSAFIYPLYPAMIRLVSWVMPATGAALLVATIAAFFFFWGLLRLADAELAAAGKVRMLLIVCVWPTSFILFTAYAEPLTLALIVWAVVFGREERWWSATACGILAGLSRPSGVLVSVVLVVLALRRRRVESLVVVLTPLGTLAYWGWLHETGRLSVVEVYRQYQGMALAPPWASLEQALRLIIHDHDHDGLLAIKLGLMILVVVLSLQRAVRLEDRLFALAVVLQILLYTGARPMAGAARYLMVAYPTFVVLGKYAEQKLSARQFGFYVSTCGLLNLVWMWSFLEWSLSF